MPYHKGFQPGSKKIGTGQKIFAPINYQLFHYQLSTNPLSIINYPIINYQLFLPSSFQNPIERTGSNFI